MIGTLLANTMPCSSWQPTSILLCVFSPCASLRQWPDSFDWWMIGLFFFVALGLPALGYFFAVLDFRRYLRSLRRAMVLVLRSPTFGKSHNKPYWATCDEPPCLETLGLRRPFTEEQVLAAYREKVKTLHPDRGGKMSDFLQLQRHFEQARRLASDENLRH